MRERVRILTLSVALLAATSAGAAAVEEWAVHGGSFNATKNPTVAEAGCELRFAGPRAGFDWTAGAAAAEDGNFWAWGGGRYTFQLDGRWAFSIGLAVALYEDGDGKDLGGPFEFRTSYEFSRRFGAHSRLGVVFYHLSNAGIYDLNPGSNSIVLAWSVRRGP